MLHHSSVPGHNVAANENNVSKTLFHLISAFLSTIARPISPGLRTYCNAMHPRIRLLWNHTKLCGSLGTSIRRRAESLESCLIAQMYDVY